jgi:hypothetical protein
MAVIGRISGPLLAQYLFRDGVNISFYNAASTEDPVLYLDVVNTRVGIRKNAPLFPLDVKGTINGDVLRIVETPGQGGTTGIGTIGKIFISTNTISSTVGPVNISPMGGDDINLLSNTTVFGDLHATGNITADGDIGLGNVPTDRLKITAEVASNIIPAIDNLYKVGDDGSSWAEGWFNKVYSNEISNTNGSISISPSDGLLEINGQLRVKGNKSPLGTAPVVTNVLYVTMDGDDTNDGAAMDETRACRTVSGAVKSPLYAPGTAIKVAAGRYYENNPILMLPNTSIIGSDLRTTFIEPINKTQDLFHVQSGCYIAQLQMSNGRSGLLPIENSPGYNRGAYATAFPPEVGGEKIDLFHSPYIQNCTNQSGPWLKDGTMFVPNQTVQIPKAVGVGSWPAGARSLAIYLTTGTIAIGDSINAGPQDLGFFDARTLILANKSFVQEQVVNWINRNITLAVSSATSIWHNFSYQQAFCYRDVGIILENLSYDTTFGGNQKSVESGLAYYNGVISLIAGQEKQTAAAINYINSLTQQIIINNTVTTYGSVTKPQVINKNLKGGSIAASGFSNNINLVTNIINLGQVAAPDIYESAGPDEFIVSAEVLLQTNRAFIQNEVTAYTDLKYSSINYSTDKCKRDLGLIVDSIGLDMLYPTADHSQSFFTGLTYWNQTEYTGDIANELTTTTNAVKFVRDLSAEVLQNIVTGARYQTFVTQVTNLTPGSAVEADVVSEEFNLIIDILIHGTVGTTDRIIPNSSTTSTAFSTWNAYNVLQANKTYIQAETIAFIEQNKSSGFLYNSATCERDIGYMLDSVCFDLLHGGNRQAIQSGVYYYTFDANSSAIRNEIPQTLYAYNTLTNLISDLVINNIITPSRGNKLTQNTTLPPASATQATELSTYIGDIVTIIQSGPSALGYNKVPIGLTRVNDADKEKAYNILQANRDFIKEEIVARVNQVYFRQHTYNQDKCYRDTGLIVDSVVQDLLYTTSSQSTFAGLQYWNQGNLTGLIGSEITTTTNAIRYARDLCKKIVVHDFSNPRYSTGTQLTTSTGNVVLPAATAAEQTVIGADFDVILDIFANGVRGVTDKIVPNGIDPSFNIDIKQAYNLLQANKAYIQTEVVAYVENTKTAGFVYDQALCYRDVGYMVDSVSFDLLYGGNKQAIQSGVYYYGYNSGSSPIYGQTTGTTAAYTHIRNIIPKILQGDAVTGYQSTVTQVFDVSTFDTSTIAAAVGKIDIITNIIENGPGVAGAKTPIRQTRSTSTSVLIAAQILNANREFIQAETIAYVNQFFAFDYNREKCRRDTGYIIDATTLDLILGGTTKAIECGVNYWVGARNYVDGQIPQTIDAINRAKEVALDVIKNNTVTPTSGNGTKQIINRYFDRGGYASQAVSRTFDIITNIVKNGPEVAPEQYVGSGLFAATGISNNDVKIAPKITSIQPFAYNESLCRRDSGYVIDGMYYDIALGTNYNAITSGNAYVRGIASIQTLRNTELSQTIQAFTYLRDRSVEIISGNLTSVTRAELSYGNLLDVITGLYPPIITFTDPVGGDANRIAAKNQLVINREFLRSAVVAWIQKQITNNISPFTTTFNYNKEKCSRDVGYIIDALCYDLLYGGNSAILVVAEAYFTSAGASVIAGETSQSVAAFQYMSTIAQQVVRGTAVKPEFGTVGNQETSGSVASSSESTTIFNLIRKITDVITAGNLAGLPAISSPSISWAPAGVQSAVSALSSAKTTMINNMITYINSAPSGNYIIGLDKPTVGHAENATLYFGKTAVFPKLVAEFTAQEAKDWGQRMIDPNGSMGGSLVDGGVISDRSPINSFVYDAFTQINQGGRGIHIINNGYAQLVSVFTVFCSIAVEVDNGGIASITNSNSNFGDLCLVAKGKGKLEFQGTVYNPAFPTFAQTGNQTNNGQYYPNGYWPQNAEMLAFIPDDAYRPHIGLVMEVIPPKTYLDNGVEVRYTNDQGLPGFLNAVPQMSVLTTGSIKITGIDTTGIAIGHTVWIRDQFGSYVDGTGTRYAATGTVVSDINYQSITLNQGLASGGGDVDNPNYFTMLFTGNAYYNVLSSRLTENPVPVGDSMLPGGATHSTAEIDAIGQLASIAFFVVSNSSYIATNPTVSQDKTNPSGAGSTTFVSDRFNEIINILTNGVASATVPRKTGTPPPQAANAILQLEANKEFLVAEVAYWVAQQNTYTMTDVQKYKCNRDIALIIDRIILDLTSGGNYNSIMSGLSYFSRAGTYHIISLEDQVRNPLLFPDGSTLSFYQRSYMSALGYTFEYVGAGTNYGSLPQVGRADPIQSQEVVQIDNGKVFFTSTDQNGDFRIGPGLVISQATGVLSGRTFTKSLFAQMTPFILAVEAGG